MKMILDLDHVVREMKLSMESFTEWKAANLEQTEEGGGSVRWSALEEGGFLDHAYKSSPDLKTG